MLDFQQLKRQPFTVFITVLCLLVYLAQKLGFQNTIFELAHYPYYQGESEQIWRYITHSLVHLSEAHILFNLLWWWQFAAIIERYLGSFKLLLIFFIATLLTGVAQNAMSGPNFFGLSGVVYAVLAYVFAANKFTQPSPLDLPNGFLYSLLIGIAIGFVSPFFGVYMGNTAHITGLILGLIWGFNDARRVQRNK
jgi:GlpG protein